MNLFKRVKSILTSFRPKEYKCGDTVYRNWGGEMAKWELLEIEGPAESCPYKPGNYVGFDLVFGALIGKLEIIDNGDIYKFREWTRDYDGRAPMYFENKKDFQDMLHNNSRCKGFYLPW